MDAAIASPKIAIFRFLHYRVATGKPVFDPQPFENPLRRMPLLGRRRLAADDDDTKPFGIEAFRY